ncbi:MAG: hypothetical protein K9L28_11305 [Synergistales bacterium]|nr:hypothetical protein [Synergistales bacterium]
MAAKNAKHGIIDVIVSENETPVGEVKSWSIDTSMGTIDVSNMGSNFKDFLVGQASWSGSLDIWFDPDDVAQDQIQTDALQGNSITLKLYPFGKASGAGNKRLTGSAFITSWSPSGAVEDAVGTSISIQGSEELTSEDVECHTISVTCGDNGSVVPGINTFVVDGENRKFNISADSGYVIDTLTVGGSAVAEASGETEYAYTFENISADDTLNVSFVSV